MNVIFFFIPFILISVIGIYQDAFAEEYRGDTWLDVTNPDGTHTQTIGLPTFIDTGQYDTKWRKIYTHYIINEDVNSITVQNGEASFVFDKTTCSAKIYEGGLINGNPIISSDSYVPKSSVDGSGIWNTVSSINNASCVTEIIETANSIEISGTKSSSAGIFKVRYLKEENKPLKTILEATNLTTLTDRRFGVTQTQSIPQIISFGGQQRDLANHVGQTFDRTWLENNQGNLLEFSQGLKFDMIDAWNNIESIKVNSIADGVASVSFNYIRNTPILLPNETLVIDPTYSSNNPTLDGYVNADAIAGAACSTTGISKTTNNVFFDIYIGNSGVVAVCSRGFAEYDISSISVYATPTSAHFLYDVQGGTSPLNCDFVGLSVNPTSATADQLWDDFATATVLVNNDASCTTTGNNKDEDLSSAGLAYITSQLSSGWAAIGVKFDSEVRDGASTHETYFGSEEDGAAVPTPTLEITYTTTCTPDAPTDATALYTAENTITITWVAPTNCLAPYQAVKIQRSETGLFNGEETTVYSSTPILTYDDTTVQNNKIYFYRIAYQSAVIADSLWGAYTNIETQFIVGSINIFESDNPIELPISFVTNAIDVDTSNVTITYDSSYTLACDFRYALGMTNTTYTGLTENAITGTSVYTNFTVNGIDNDIIDIYCWDTLDNSTDGSERIGQNSIPLFDQINNFQNGVFGTDGKFGALDLMTLIIVIVSMIAFNRTHPYVGVITMVAMFAVAGWYGLVQPITVMSGFLILAVALAIAYGRRENEI